MQSSTLRAVGTARARGLAAALLALALTFVLAPVAGAQGSPQSVPPAHVVPSPRERIIMANLGWRFSIAPGVFIPIDRGSVGFSISGDVRYGLRLGPSVLAPGVRIAAYFPSEFTAVIGLATLRVTFPVGPVGPFVTGGLGPGFVSDPSEVGLAYLGGGGVIFYPTPRFAFGAEVSYQGVTGTGFGALFLGPTLFFSF